MCSVRYFYCNISYLYPFPALRNLKQLFVIGNFGQGLFFLDFPRLDEPLFFLFFGAFHLHRVWGLADRESYAAFWLGVLTQKGPLYFGLMGLLAVLCLAGVATFFRNWGRNPWWRWIYLFGGSYVLFDLLAIAAGLSFWHSLLAWMFDVTSPCWNFLWGFFVLLGGASAALGLSLLVRRT